LSVTSYGIKRTALDAFSTANTLRLIRDAQPDVNDGRRYPFLIRVKAVKRTGRTVLNAEITEVAVPKMVVEFGSTSIEQSVVHVSDTDAVEWTDAPTAITLYASGNEVILVLATRRPH
jgi:hypothetical protein